MRHGTPPTTEDILDMAETALDAIPAVLRDKVRGTAILVEDVPDEETLADLGLPADKLDWTAEQAFGIDRLIKNNPRPFDLDAMKRLVNAAYTGDFAASAN